MELKSSCPDSDFLLGLLFPEEDIIGCKRLQSFDEFTTSLASWKETENPFYKVITRVAKGRVGSGQGRKKGRP